MWGEVPELRKELCIGNGVQAPERSGAWRARRCELRLLGLFDLCWREYDLCGIIAVGTNSHVRSTDATRGSVASRGVSTF